MRQPAATALACAAITCASLMGPVARADITYSTTLESGYLPPLVTSSPVTGATLNPASTDISLGSYTIGHNLYDNNFTIHSAASVMLSDSSGLSNVVYPLGLTITGTVQSPGTNGNVQLTITESAGPSLSLTFDGYKFTFTPDATFTYNGNPMGGVVTVPLTATLSATAVPEPASALLLAPGAALAWLAARRRSRGPA